MKIRPVCAPVGTVAVTCWSEFTVNWAGTLLPKPTPCVCVRLFPVMVTTVPTGPLGGLKLTIDGATRNLRLLLSTPPGVVTAINPVVAPAGTAVVR